MPTRSFRSAVAPCLVAVALICCHAGFASAQDRDVVLRFLPPDESEITGYTLYVTDVESEVEAVLEAGFVTADADGVARTTVVLDASRSYRVDMTAHNQIGESAHSNEILISAENPVCDPALCDDGNACTSDHCGEVECANTPLPNGSLCDDGYIDTIDDQCTRGICEGTILACQGNPDCDDGNICNGLERCDGGTACLAGIPLECGNPSDCAVPRCDPVVGCLTDFEPDGTACDDRLTETQNDVCQAGVCQGAPIDSDAELVLERLDPEMLSPGNRVVRIHGQGFALGAVLSFLNGEGKTPKVKSILLIDSRTLEAEVEISRRGPKRPRFFDARVSLPDGRQVFLPEGLRIDP